MTAQPISRRSLTAGLALAPLAGLPALASASFAADRSDAVLLSLGAELEAAWAKERVGLKSWSDAEYSAAVDKSSAIVDRIVEEPARTLDGLRIKARALAWCHSGEVESLGIDENPTTDIRVADSIIRDLLSPALGA